MSRGKHLSLEEARTADQIEQFCKVFYDHPLVTVGLHLFYSKVFQGHSLLPCSIPAMLHHLPQQFPHSSLNQDDFR